jgi:hypothetical protein
VYFLKELNDDQKVNAYNDIKGVLDEKFSCPSPLTLTLSTRGEGTAHRGSLSKILLLNKGTND